MLGHLVVRMSRKHNWYAYALWALSIGVATVANKKALFVMLVDHIPWFDAHWSFFCQIWLIHYAKMLLRWLHLEIWRFLCSQQRHNRLLYPLAHARGIITNPCAQYWSLHTPIMLPISSLHKLITSSQPSYIPQSHTHNYTSSCPL